MPNWGPSKDKTYEAFADPQQGDCFSEMGSFWIYVVRRTETHVITVECSAPCTLPYDGVWHRYTLDQFRERFRYKNREGYTVRHYWREPEEVESWLPPADLWEEPYKSELESLEAFHPRAMKLMRKRKNFVVVAEDEPYFLSVYAIIRAHEIASGTWFEEDEVLFSTAVDHYNKDRRL